MNRRSVVIRWEDELNGWKIYWSDTNELASKRLFRTIEEAGPIARELMGENQIRRVAAAR